MAAFSDFLETAIRDHFMSDTQLALEDTFIALFSADPTDAGTGAELTGNGYARVQVNQDGTTAPFWEASGSNGMTNDSEVAFPAASGGDWLEATHFGVMDASTSGNLLFHEALDAAKTVTDGDTARFAAGTLTVTFD